MMNWGNGWDGGWGAWLMMFPMMLIFWGAIAWVLVVAIRHSGGTGHASPGSTTGRPDAMQILDERFARGGDRRAGIPRTPGRFAVRLMTPTQPISRTALAAVIVAVVLAAAVSTFVLTSPTGPGPFWRGSAAELRCDVPPLPGSLVDVTLADYGPAMMGGRSPMMVSVRAQPQAVKAGAVSLIVRNRGQLVHELTVMPVASPGPGSRITGPDGTVGEEGSLGHAETACGTGEGDGIPAGGTSWLTLELPPGQYELICNEPWHYQAGMYQLITAD